MEESLVCWNCGETLVDVLLPFSRREECDHCNEDQHVCKMCHFYDQRVNDECQQDRAESVTNKERANFCDYFKANPNAYIASENKDASVEQSKQALADLFGDADHVAELDPTEGSSNAAGQKRYNLEQEDIQKTASERALDELSELFSVPVSDTKDDS